MLEPSLVMHMLGPQKKSRPDEGVKLLHLERGVKLSPCETSRETKTPSGRKCSRLKVTPRWVRENAVHFVFAIGLGKPNEPRLEQDVNLLAYVCDDTVVVSAPSTPSPSSPPISTSSST